MPTNAWPFWKTVPRFDREYSAKDLLRAGRSWLRKNGAGRPEIEHLFALDHCQFLRSGRECLYLILKILNLRPKSIIGVPLYCCASVFEAIAVAGHVPFFLDVDLDSYSLDEEFLRRHAQRLDALVVVHTFGYPGNLKRLQSCLAGRNIPIIEDCAHALFTEFDGRLAGTWGDASFLTFGMHKPAAAGGGAVLIINNPDLASAAKREFIRLGRESSGQELRHSLICWARSLAYHRVTYGALLASPLGRYRDEERGVPDGDELVKIEQNWSPAKIRSVDQVLVAGRIHEFRRKMFVLAENTQKLRDGIAESSLALPEEPAHGKWNHFMVPVRYPSGKDRESGRRLLTRRGVDTSPLYQNCARNARWFGYQGGCPQAELAGQTVCTVPNHVWLSDAEIAYIAESLRMSAPVHQAPEIEYLQKSAAHS